MDRIEFLTMNEAGNLMPTKVLPIPLSVLEKTQTLLEYDGRLPSTQPIKHYDFIKQIQDIVSKDHSIEQEPIWVTNAAAKRISILDPNKIGVPESWLFQRLVTRINITGAFFSDYETNANIAIGFTDNGIQVAFGQNVRICSNQCIFGGRYMSTYGRQKMPFEKMMDVIREYSHNLEAIREKDLTILNSFKQISLDSHQTREFIGDIHLRAVKDAYNKSQNFIAPLNISQVSALSRNVSNRIPGLFEEDNTESITSLYDLYNDGTQIFKPERSEITTLWEDVDKWGQFVDALKLSFN